VNWEILFIFTLTITVLLFDKFQAVKEREKDRVEREKLYTRIMCRDIQEFERYTMPPPSGSNPYVDKLNAYEIYKSQLRNAEIDDTI